jgi:hypothetical protein
MSPQHVSTLINESPMNRGMDGNAWIRTEGNLAITNAAGDVLIFEQAADGVYEFHWLTMKTKGREAIAITLAAIDKVFLDTGCALMFGLVSEDRRDSNLMARWIGAKPLGKVSTPDGICELFIMTREMRGGN